jgi:hypothetical protein
MADHEQFTYVGFLGLALPVPDDELPVRGHGGIDAIDPYSPSAPHAGCDAASIAL